MTQPPESSVPPGSNPLPPPPAPPPVAEPPPPPPPPAAYGEGPSGAVVPPGTYPDGTSGLLLPQGTELASPARRIGAYFLTVPLVIVTLVVGYLIWGLVIWSRGQTPTYQVLGMRCWRPQTARVAGFWWMALREIVGRFVEGLFITGVISLILMLTGRERKTLHDMIAGTVVLRDPNKVLAG
ncbi:MAG TPA: RDD family protein [Acidimicrobiales bacterium]|nr:RDD family protein [Acidimicrobiales bacterium]